MRKQIALGLLFCATVASTQSLVSSALSVEEHRELCEGFLPKNDLYIPISPTFSDGMTEKEFNEIIDGVAAVYADDFARLGTQLEIVKRWNDGSVNASAHQSGNSRIVTIYGGLARFESITRDGLALVVCHEIGHHLGGAPKAKRFFLKPWSSNEGAADYFATLKCLRRYFEEDDNEKALTVMEVDSAAVAACDELYTTSHERSLCARSAMAGASVAALFQSLSGAAVASLSTPDTTVVSKTNDGHPAPQCRLDTFFEGALCTEPAQLDLSDIDYKQGSCHDKNIHHRGLRPSCWFNAD